MIDCAKLCGGRETYYEREIADSRADYYAGKGESQGRYFGNKARSMGYHGVAADGTEQGNQPFRRVFYGRDPGTGELLGAEHRKDGVHGYDLVFRPVKSVSVLYGLGSLEVSAKVREAHHAGIEAALAYLDQHVGARRGRNGVEKVAGDGLLAIGFDHRTSRLQDPLLHTHLIVANRIQSPTDGRWTAVDGKTLYAHLMAAQALHRATIQHELSRTMGLEWTVADQHGNREIAGVPPSVIKAFSKRREEIECKLEARDAAGLSTSRKAADLVAHKDRQGKEHGVEEHTLRGRWAAGLAELDGDAAGQTRRVLADAHRGLARRRQLTLNRDEVSAAFVFLAGPEGLTREASTFARQDVIQRLGDQLATATPVELERLADAFLADPGGERVLAVVTDPRYGERRWTTPGIRRLEEGMIHTAVQGATAGRGIVAAELIDAAVERAAKTGRPLGPDQEAALRGVLDDGQVVSPVIGRAGSGKTTLADSIRVAYQQAGYDLVGLAPTGAAAQQLARDTGMVTGTIDQALADLDRGEKVFSSGQVVLVDEASMAATRRLAPLLTAAADAGAKVVLVGDAKQLSSVEAGGGFEALTNRLGAYELTINRRQHNPIDQKAVELIRDGLADDALELWDTHGRVHRVGESLAETDQAMVAAWWTAYNGGEDAGMFAPRRVEVDRLNDHARALLQDAGRLGEDTMTVAEREFRVGDRVVCGWNALNPNSRRYLGVANGTKAHVTALDPKRGEIRIRLDDDVVQGEDAGGGSAEVTLPRWYLQRDLGGARRALDHAYATTIHKAQGATYDRGFGRFGTEMTQELGYVAATRARKRLDVFLVGETRPAPELAEQASGVDLPPGPASLPGDRARSPQATTAAAVSRSGAQVLALDARRPGDAVAQRSTRELREEAERLDAEVVAQRPRPRAVERARLSRQLAETTPTPQVNQGDSPRPPDLAQSGATPDPGKDAHAAAAARVFAQPGGPAAQQRTAEQLRQVERHERQRVVWEAQHAPELARHRAVQQELGWRSRQQARLDEALLPQHLKDFLGPRPDSLRGQRRWRQLAGEVAAYRTRYDITDSARALGGTPKGPEVSLQQRQEHRMLREMAERLWQRQRDRGAQERDRGESRSAAAPETAARAVGQTEPAEGAARVDAARRPPSRPELGRGLSR